MADVPATVTYASIVSSETVCIAPTMAALNTLKVMTVDIINAYIIAPNKEKSGNCLVLILVRTKSIT